MPLAMAFAIASGATPAQGLYTAIVAGLVTTLFGGTRVQISGPTGAFIAVLAGITAQYGIAGLQAATVMAGCILLVMGIARLGTVIKFIPAPVIVGFTAGIAVIIWIGQWKDFFGLYPVSSGLHFHEKFIAVIRALPAFAWPSIGLSDLLQLVGPAFAIALLGAIESLLTAVVADGMTGSRHDSNQELIGQGAANIIAPLFGGFAATGAIARTAADIRNGATSPVAGIVHALFLLCGIHDELRLTLAAAGVFGLVGKENVCDNMTRVAERVTGPAM